MKYTFYYNTDLKAVVGRVGDLDLLRAYSNPESIGNNIRNILFKCYTFPGFCC